MEPQHGPARLTIADPPVLKVRNNIISALLPDGRWWQDRLEFEGGKLLKLGEDSPGYGFEISIGGEWLELKGNHFLNGSNWTAECSKPEENIGIQSDGTLWVSSNQVPEFRKLNNQVVFRSPSKLVKFGEDSDWKDVMDGPGFEDTILLKKDGSLWDWGINNLKVRGLRNVVPHQLGSDSDWARICFSPYFGFYAWKKNGQAWKFSRPITNSTEIKLDHDTIAQRCEPFDNSIWRSLATCCGFKLGVRDDGTLWSINRLPPDGSFNFVELNQPVQIGTSTNWLSLASAGLALTALKSDGTLWEWDFNGWWEDRKWPLLQPPKRLGIHSDWVALGESSHRIVSIAADGSLWHWVGLES
jgi:hypothetical protein